MRDPKMAELEICQAPLASFESEDWNDFHEFQSAVDLDNIPKDSGPIKNRILSNVVDNFSETFSGSLEDLVNTFDEKITKCFCNYEEKVENFAPVQVRSQEEIVNDCQLWWTITGNFGNILPIDWSKTYARQLQTKALNLRDPVGRTTPDLDLSDDEDLTRAFDMHSIIISSLHHEPLITADEVINEIEDMLQEDSVATPTDADMLSPIANELLQFRVKNDLTPAQYEANLQKLSLPALNELLEETECLIKDYSETLIHELALRDELEYEKELKNQFISLLLGIQKKRRESYHQDKRKAKKTTNQRQANANIANDTSSYLTTVIPYHVNQGAPTSDQLQNYIKILKAINDDSPQVPSLLTDYILKVLCPT